MTQNNEQLRAPDLGSANAAEVMRAWERQFGSYLERMNITDPEDRAAALRLHTEAMHCQESIKFLALSGLNGSQSRLDELWNRTGNIAHRMAQLRQKNVFAHGEGENAETAVAKLQERINAAFRGDEFRTIREQLLSNVTALSDATAGEREISARKFHALQKSLTTLGPLSKPQQEVVRELTNISASYRGIDSETDASVAYLEDKEKKGQNVPSALGRAAVLMGTGILALWSLAAKNTPLAAFYAGLSYYIARGNRIFDTADKKTLGSLKGLYDSAEMKKIASTYLQGADGEKAVNRYYEFVNGKDVSRGVLAKRLAGQREGVTDDQLKELCGSEDDPLFRVAMLMKPMERRAFFSNLINTTNSDARSIAGRYLAGMNEMLNSPPDGTPS